MSQAGIINTQSGPPPPPVPTSFVTDINSPAIPAANVLDVIGGSVTTNNVLGIQTDGSSGGNILTVELTNRLHGTTTTVGAVTSDAVTFALGATPAAYFFSVSIVVFNASGPAGAGYETYTTLRTDGATATIIDATDSITQEDPALITTTADVVVSGNNAIVRVGGVAGLTIDWVVVGTYIKAI